MKGIGQAGRLLGKTGINQVHRCGGGVFQPARRPQDTKRPEKAQGASQTIGDDGRLPIVRVRAEQTIAKRHEIAGAGPVHREKAHHAIGPVIQTGQDFVPVVPIETQAAQIGAVAQPTQGADKHQRQEDLYGVF